MHSHKAPKGKDMLIFITVCLIVCFACTGKHDVFVKDVFKTDTKTGEKYPGDRCSDCEDAHFCTGYMSEKHCVNAPIHYFPCDSNDPEQLKNLGIFTEESCDICEHPDDCAHCAMKHVMLKDTDCLNCLAADYCKGIRHAMNTENPELICSRFSTED